MRTEPPDQCLWAANTVRAFLPLIRENHGHIVFISSTVSRVPYERGAAYAASKHALRALAQTLRLEEAGHGVRVSEVAPGMMMGDASGGAFMRDRMDNDSDRVQNVYRGIAPLVPADIAECVRWVISLPPHVNVDDLLVKPIGQPSHDKVIRDDS